jgi:hypothetical protein
MRIFERIVKEVLAPLKSNKVDYCIIGGLAVIAAGVRRGTMDFDIVIDKLKWKQALQILYKNGFKLVTSIDETKKKLLWCQTLKQAIAYISLTNPQVFKVNKDGWNGLYGDIWLDSKIPFDELRQHTYEVKIFNEEIRFASINDLIRLKKDTGRNRDKQDIEELRKIRQKYSEFTK